MQAYTLLGADQLDFEDQDGVRRDRALPLRAVADSRRYDDKARAAGFHTDDTLFEPGNDLPAADREAERLLLAAGTDWRLVDQRAVGQPDLVINIDFLAGGHGGPAAGPNVAEQRVRIVLIFIVL